MQFYSNSTGGNREEIESYANKQLSEALLINQAGKPGQAPFDFITISHYCRELIEVTTSLNLELLKNNQLIDMQAALGINNHLQQVRQQQEGSVKDSEDNSTASRKNGSEINLDMGSRGESRIEASRNCRKKQIVSQSDSYHPEQEEACYQEPTYPRLSESKNIPKNYSKAIINFIKKHQNLTQRTLSYLQLDHNQFMKEVEVLNGRVNSIAQLQWLWGGVDNRFAKAFRILSLEYLRKHSLSYIFNSRVNIHGKHLKYRYKMIESVGSPQSFTCMKEF